LAQVVADYEQQDPTVVAASERDFDDATAVLALPRPYRKQLRTTNGQERRERGDPPVRARHPHLPQS
jgi:putative transposase